jgi:hypothetical protein
MERDKDLKASTPSANYITGDRPQTAPIGQFDVERGTTSGKRPPWQITAAFENGNAGYGMLGSVAK